MEKFACHNDLCNVEEVWKQLLRSVEILQSSKTHVSVDDYDCPFETSQAGSGGHLNGAIYFAQCGIVQLQLEFGKSSMIPFWTGKLASTSNTKLGKSQSAWLNEKFSPTRTVVGERVSVPQAHQHFLKIGQRENLKKKHKIRSLIGGRNKSSLHHLPNLRYCCPLRFQAIAWRLHEHPGQGFCIDSVALH